MQLEQLLRQLPGAIVRGSVQRSVTSVTHDSRQALPGSLFVAVPGYSLDGHYFIADAIKRGATVVVGEREWAVPDDVVYVQTPASRHALAALAAEFYGHPSRQLRLIGVTGTNGKTTTTFLIQAILEAAGYRTGLIGTVHNYSGAIVHQGERTTPEAPELQKLLANMVADGCTHAVMEVSSHALALGRVEQCAFDVAVFTNLSHDHLDFHESLETYREVKQRLFRNLGQAAVTDGNAKPMPYAVINEDDASADAIRSVCQTRVTGYGCLVGEMKAENVVAGPHGLAYTLVWPKGRLPLHLGLAGRFNVYNSMAAAAVALQEGIDPATIQRALATVKSVPGRLESIDLGQDFSVFVDYAHTPDGLANILHAAREIRPGGRVIVVFGCGGDRDRNKRPIMGRLAVELADLVIVTSDNPRSEKPERILADIMTGITAAQVPRGRYVIELDRVEAIAHAMRVASPGDIVLIAGKGHETRQIFADRTVHFDDRLVVADLLREQFGYGLDRHVAGGQAT